MQRVGAGGVQVAADRVGRRKAQLGQGHRQHRRRRRLAVGAGDRDRAQASIRRARASERCTTGMPSSAARASSGLSARMAEETTTQPASSARLGRVTDVHRHAQRAQGLGGGRVLGVTARHHGATLGEDLRDARHSGAADADEVRSVHGGGDAGCHACLLSAGTACVQRPSLLRAVRVDVHRPVTAPCCARTASAPARPPCAGLSTPSRGGRTPPRSGVGQHDHSSAPISATSALSASSGWSSMSLPSASLPAACRAARETSSACRPRAAHSCPRACPARAPPRPAHPGDVVDGPQQAVRLVAAGLQQHVEGDRLVTVQGGDEFHVGGCEGLLDHQYAREHDGRPFFSSNP